MLRIWLRNRIQAAAPSGNSETPPLASTAVRLRAPSGAPGKRYGPGRSVSTPAVSCKASARDLGMRIYPASRHRRVVLS